jgi:hypothetical protein
MSRFLYFWLLFILSNVLDNASRLFDCLTLLKESDELEGVSGHHLVQVCKHELMHLGLHKEDCLLFSCAEGTSIIQRM